MDIFVEWMIKRKKTAFDYIKIVLSVIGIALMIAMILLYMVIGGYFEFLIACGIIYILYRVIVGTRIEYEYSFTNGSLDVDRIINAQRRRRVTTLNARNIDVMASIKSDDFLKYKTDSGIKKIYACTSLKDEGVYFILYDDDKGRKLLVFSPNDAIKDGFKKFNPQKVFLND